MYFNLINIIESTIMLSIFYLFYEIFLKKETFFKMNRMYLMSSLLLAVVIPFLNFSTHLFSSPESNSAIIHKLVGIKQGYNELKAVIIYANSGLFTWSVIKYYVTLIYFTGVAVSLAFFVFGVVKIILLIMTNHSENQGKYRIVKTSEPILPFSLFKWIIINPEKYSSDDIKQIIAHEKMHAFQLHSFDLILIEILVVLFWFNPFIYWYRKSIREVHEYLADRAVVESGYDRIDYQQLLLSQVSGDRILCLTSRFSYSLSKNRLKMLSIIKSKNSSKIKIALAIPLIVMAIFLFVDPMGFLKAPESSNLKGVLTSSKDKVNERASELRDHVKLDGDVYDVVELMPKFRGQNADAFRMFIQKNLSYPLEAQKEGIDGRVFIQFIIDTEGNLVNAEIIRGVNFSLDDEALRVVNLSPKWEPAMHHGEKVNVRFTFPIIFKLH